jgi:hypothetical protein
VRANERQQGPRRPVWAASESKADPVASALRDRTSVLPEAPGNAERITERQSCNRRLVPARGSSPRDVTPKSHVAGVARARPAHIRTGETADLTCEADCLPLLSSSIKLVCMCVPTASQLLGASDSNDGRVSAPEPGTQMKCIWYASGTPVYGCLTMCLAI